jgi:hypothetical protein
MSRESTTQSTRSGLTAEQRREILAAIARAVRATMGHPTPLEYPRYPDAIPEIDRHIDWVADIVQRNGPTSRAVVMLRQSCAACPHQYPGKYCPLRPRGGCVLYRCADAIAEAVAANLPREPGGHIESSCKAEEASHV